jgi:hypothetical protein
MVDHDGAKAYRSLSREDFDAIVTGELTHYAVWLEVELDTAIENYFALPNKTRQQFRRLILQREGMAFHTKIDLVRSILKDDGFDKNYVLAWKNALADVEELKRISSLRKNLAVAPLFSVS